MLYVKSGFTEIKIDPVKKIKFKWSGNTYEMDDVSYYVLEGYESYGSLQVKKIFHPIMIYSPDQDSDYDRAFDNKKSASELAQMFCRDIKNGRKTYVYDSIIKCIPEFIDVCE